MAILYNAWEPPAQLRGFAFVRTVEYGTYLEVMVRSRHGTRSRLVRFDMLIRPLDVMAIWGSVGEVHVQLNEEEAAIEALLR